MKFLTAAGLEFVLTFISHAINLPFYYYSLKVPRNDIIKDLIPQVTRQVTHCKTNLGYFDTDLGYFSALKLPSCLASVCPPERPETIATRFLLSTRSLGEKYITWDDSSALKMFTSDSVVIIVPGTFSSYLVDPWFNQTKYHWLRLGADVILVDWSAGNKEPLVASANIQTIGAQIGQLALYLGIISKVNCVGVASGAHACGFAGTWLTKKGHPKLSKCTGIDPMGKMFDNCPSNYTLTKDDCDVVSVIHTSYTPNGIGLDQSSGHCDFWVNYRTQFDDCEYKYKSSSNLPLKPIKSISDAIKSSKVTSEKGPFKKLSTDLLVNSLSDSFICNHKKAMNLYLSQLISYPRIGYTARPCKSKLESCNLNDNLFFERKSTSNYYQKSKRSVHLKPQPNELIHEPLPPFDRCSQLDDQDFCLCLRSTGDFNGGYKGNKFDTSGLIKTKHDVI